MSENPYDPPVSNHSPDDLPDAPLSSGWRLDGGRLLVRQDAQLPMIDPFNGVSEERMTLRNLSIRYLPIWYCTTWALGLLSFAGGVYLLPHRFAHVFLTSGGAVISLCIITGMFLSTVRIRVLVTHNSNLKIRAGKFINAIMAISVVLYMLTSKLDLANPSVSTASTVISILFGLALIAAVTLRMLKWRLTCRKRVRDRYEIRGLHPAALLYLEERHTTR